MTLIFTIAATAIIILYDVYAAYRGGSKNTISYLVYTKSKDYPVIPFAAGVLLGHLFWVQHMVEP